MSQHGYMRHTATPPLVLDLIRLIQSKSCGTKSNFTAESTKFKITVVVFPGISGMSQHGYLRHTATPPFVLDLIRLIQSEAEKVDCFRIITFHLLSSALISR